MKVALLFLLSLIAIECSASGHTEDYARLKKQVEAAVRVGTQMRDVEIFFNARGWPIRYDPVLRALSHRLRFNDRSGIETHSILILVRFTDAGLVKAVIVDESYPPPAR